MKPGLARALVRIALALLLVPAARPQLAGSTMMKAPTAPKAAVKTGAIKSAFKGNVLTNLGDNGKGAWGLGFFGQFQGVAPAFPDRRVAISAKKVAVGQGHVLALKADGALYAWGDNSVGQLGDGSKDNRCSPVRVPLVDVVDISAAGTFSAAVDSSGQVYQWGQRGTAFGSSGAPETGDPHPKPVQGLSNVKAVAVGPVFGVALTRDGKVWTWGSNLSGVRGTGQGSWMPDAPTRVNEMQAVSSISAGYDHVLAIQGDAVWAWGGNSGSQLGDGTTQNRASPTRVIGITGATAIAAGEGHSLAIGPGGAVLAWGMNNKHQLGDGTILGKASPIQLAGLSGFRDVAAGMFESFALDANGKLWGWGDGVGPQTPSRLASLIDLPLSQVVGDKTFYSMILK